LVCHSVNGRKNHHHSAALRRGTQCSNGDRNKFVRMSTPTFERNHTNQSNFRNPSSLSMNPGLKKNNTTYFIIAIPV
jgi:hypothetical protein